MGRIKEYVEKVFATAAIPETGGVLAPCRQYVLALLWISGSFVRNPWMAINQT